MDVNDMVVVDLLEKVIKGKLKMSSDLSTHLYLYSIFFESGCMVHRHSVYTVSFAEAIKEIFPFEYNAC
jgi:L-ribulose-5-phosphate 4-epimerase